MPYQTIPDVPTEANVSKLIGRLRANFLSTVGKNLDSLEQVFQSGCPDQIQSQKVINILNNIKNISVNTTDRLSRFKKIPRPLTRAGGTLVKVARGLKFIPFPPFFPGAKVSSAITTIQELGTQLRTTATSIELALSTTVDLDNLLKRAANVGERVDIALESCQLASNRGITIPSDLLYQLVSGTDSESSRALKEINKLLGQDDGTGGNGTGSTGTGGTGAGSTGTGGTGAGGIGAGSTGTGGTGAGGIGAGSTGTGGTGAGGIGTGGTGTGGTGAGGIGTGGTGTGGTGAGGTGAGGTGAGGTGTGGSSLDSLGKEQYVGPDGTIYTLEVIQVKSDFTRAPRRQAIAKNQEGKKKFESSKSFSSSAEVLKREVKFRIDNSQV